MEILKDKKIFLIEDNQMLAEVVLRKLKTLTNEVRHYTNGLEGLAAIRHYKPDLVLLDIMLPVMNGYEVLQIMHTEKLTEIHPVLVISNSGQPVEIARIHELGAKDYLVKADFTPNEVIDKARLVLQNQSLAKRSTDEQYINPTPLTGSSPQSEATLPTEPPKILVIEDDPMLRNMLSMKFSRHSLVYMFVSDGAQALDSAGSFNPDVIVLDLMLPGKNGFEIFAEFKQHPQLQHTPVIIFSNKSDEADRTRALEMGAHSYLVKAMTDLNELIALLRDLTTKARLQAG
jgi:DNA-binding response OmpR family regulator